MIVKSQIKIKINFFKIVQIDILCYDLFYNILKTKVAKIAFANLKSE